MADTATTAELDAGIRAVLDIITLIKVSDQLDKTNAELGGFMVPTNVERYISGAYNDPRIDVPIIVSDKVSKVGIIVNAR